MSALLRRLFARLARWVLPDSLDVMPRGNVRMVDGLPGPWAFYGGGASYRLAPCVLICRTCGHTAERCTCPPGVGINPAARGQKP